MTQHIRSPLTTELALLHALAARTLSGESTLSCREAATLCGVSIPTLRRAASRAIACGLIDRVPLTAHDAPLFPRNTRPMTLVGLDLIALMDLTHPTAEYRLLSTALQACGVGALPYNHTIAATDNLAQLTHRISKHRMAIDPTTSRPMAIIMLFSPDSIDTETNPYTRLAAHPKRCIEALAPLQVAGRRPRPPLLLRETDALTTAFASLPSLSDRTTLLYLRLAPRPHADLFVRTTTVTPFRPSPYGAPLTHALRQYLQAHADRLVPDTSPLCRFFRDFTTFCHPDAVLLEGLPSAVPLHDLSPCLPPDTTLLDFPREPHIPSLATRGAILLTMRRLWEKRLTAALAVHTSPERSIHAR